MDSKHFKRSPEGLVEPEEARGRATPDTEDVEGHGLPLTPPPSIGTGMPGHGGEIAMPAGDEDDV